ncbi:polymorphic toxin-type HINT domain-containing protein, partial [Streptomyces sp. NRRL F-4489]|uniref:polymorphic toxin-type HINT domain-containing protein n=1 Tax=Streptomyces sp. NRRL F-4489 TaxID=1609095 RepID=UPI000B223C0B
QTLTTTPPANPADPLSAQTTTTELDPLRGQPTATVDTNGKRTVMAYDALGRSTKVWLPDRRTTTLLPNYQFDYFIEEGKPAAVATRTLNPEGGSQTTSYTLYDGYLRARQTQAPGPDAGRLISDTFYDARGLVTKTFAPYYSPGAPARDIFKPADALSVETQTWKTYDGLGRETESRDVAGNGEGGKVLAVTSTTYGGDRTTVVPPEGATAATTVIDARGRTTQLLQHRTRAADAPADTTRYTYTPTGKLAEVTDPAGNSWRYTYDQRGNQIQASDPDKGVLKSTYDDRNQVTTTEDANGAVLATVYDGLGRKTELHDKAADGPLRAKWVYDTVAKSKGQLAESTRYIDGQPYTTKITQYDPVYRPQRTSVVIPDTEGKLAGTYQASQSYFSNGLPMARSMSQTGSLLGKGWNYSYANGTLRLTSIFGDGIRSDATYNLTGQPLTYRIGTSTGKPTQITNTYEWGTRRVSNSRVDRQDVAGVDKSATYTYDPAGNIKAISDVSRSGTDTQCFTYDYLRRVTEAWTQSEKTCATAPAGNLVSGPAPYWQSYGYDLAGNRTTLTRHDPAGDAAKDTKSTYTYPKPGTPQPHTLTAVDTTAPTGTSTSSYTYDPTGNTATRTLHGDKQTLTWDAEGHLTKVTEPAGDKGTKTTAYVYDADGNRLITRTDTKTILTLGDHTEVTLDKGSDTPKATRYIPLGGGNQAVLSDDGTYTLTLADHQNTGQLAVNPATGALTQRRTLPFGGPRGTQPSAWPGTKGFVGGTDDTADTGLTHLGAREYDPETGRFLSVDPLMDLTDPQQINGYTYSNNNPITFSDPTGLMNAINNGGTGCDPVTCPWVYWGPSEERQAYLDALADSYPAKFGHYRQHPKAAVLPGLNIDATWDRADEFTNRVYDRATEQKLFYQGMFNIDPSEPSIRWTLAGLRMTVCAEMKKHCQQSLTELMANMMAGGALAGGGGEGPGGRLGLRGSGRKASPCHSFLPDTEVALANGERKRIEDVKTGDKVIATDPETGKTTTRPVVATIVTKDDKHFTDLTVTTPSGASSIIATDTHPFWSVDQKKWINAGDLHPNTELRTPQGTTVKITAVRHFKKQQQTHDLTIAGTHTYYVLAGQTSVLVHNSNGCVNWASNSVKTWGHTFKTHGAGAKNTKALTDRARSTRNQQGQWLDNDAAAEFLKGLHVEGAGPRSVRIPDGLGQVIMPDGSIVQARVATIVPSPNGLYKTGFPIIGPN